MKEKTVWIGGIAVAAVVVIVVVILATLGERTEVIKIGAVLPLTGDIASYGKNAQSGIDLAVEEINRSGGINGKLIKVIYGNNKGTASEAVKIIKKLITVDRVSVVIGAAASSVTLSMCPIANESKVVLMSPISSSQELTTKGGEYFFRVCPSDAFQSRILADWMWNRRLKTVGVIYVNNAWGIGLKDEFVESYKKLGGKVAAVEASMEGQRDFRTQISKVLGAKPEALFGATYGKEGGILLKQAKELGVKMPIFGGDVWSSPELIESAGDAAEGVYFTVPTKLTGDKYQQFATKYRQRYGKEPEVYAAYSYDAMNIIAKGLAEGHMSGQQLREYLAKMPAYDGVTGVTKFDEHGDVLTKSFSRQQIVGGKHTEVK